MCVFEELWELEQAGYDTCCTQQPLRNYFRDTTGQISFERSPFSCVGPVTSQRRGPADRRVAHGVPETVSIPYPNGVKVPRTSSREADSLRLRFSFYQLIQYRPLGLSVLIKNAPRRSAQSKQYNLFWSGDIYLFAGRNLSR